MVFAIYRRGQGKYTRLTSAFVMGGIAALGCLQLYKKLQANEVGVWIETLVPAGLFIALALVIAWLSNKPSLADFLIDSEGELKKVSWSSRGEIAVSTFIVIVVVVSMALFLGATDITFQVFFRWLLQ